MAFHQIAPDVESKENRCARSPSGVLWSAYVKVDNHVAPTQWGVYCAYSTDNGVSWTEEEVAAPSAEAVDKFPAICCDSQERVHVAWTQAETPGGFRDTLYRRRLADGTWQPQENATNNATLSNLSEPWMDTDASDQPHVLFWRENYRAYYTYRTGGGWQPIEYASRWPCEGCDLRVDLSGDIYSVYHRMDGPNWDIRYRKRVAGVWGVEQVVTNLAIGVWNVFPKLAIATDGTLHFTWVGRGWGTYPGKYQILYRQREPGGAWLATELVTDVDYDQSLWFPQVGLTQDDLTAYINWHGPGFYAPDLTRDCTLHRKRISGVWGSVENLDDTGIYGGGESVADSLFPRDGGVSVNRPASASDFALTLFSGYGIYFYIAVPAVPFVKNKAYALAREEL